MTSPKYSSVSQVENREEDQESAEKCFLNLCASKPRKYIIVGVVIIAIIITGIIQLNTQKKETELNSFLDLEF